MPHFPPSLRHYPDAVRCLPVHVNKECEGERKVRSIMCIKTCTKMVKTDYIGYRWIIPSVENKLTLGWGEEAQLFEQPGELRA